MTNQEIEIILSSKIFKGFDENTIIHGIKCLRGKVIIYQDSTQLFQLGETTTLAPLIIDGFIDVSIINNAANKFTMMRYKKGDILAVANALCHCPHQTMDIRTHGETKILMLDFSHISNSNNYNCPYKLLLMQNLLSILSNRLLFIQNKFQIITQKTLKDKLLTHFNKIAIIQKSRTIELNYTREELAQLISADRSAVCRELNKMQSEGIIDIEKNKITLLQECDFICNSDA